MSWIIAPRTRLGKIWARLDSGVLHPEARDHLFYIIHERVFTRKRGHRILRNVIQDPTCIRCQTSVETIIHRFSSCSQVLEAWNQLRNILEILDNSLCFETDHSLINLYYSEPISHNSVLWLIGEYIMYIEQEVVLSNRKVSGHGLLNRLQSRWLECSKLSIPDLELIPGLFPTGVGWRANYLGVFFSFQTIFSS